MDGLSTDGTLEELDRYRGQLGKVISEADSGVFGAMNKGLSHARGKWVLFLGADDQLADARVLTDARNELETSTASFVCGRARYCDGRVYHLHTPPRILYRNFIHHQACFYRREVISRFRYDPSLRYQGDYDLNLRMILAGERLSAWGRLVSYCASGGLSDAGAWANYREEISVRHRYFPGVACWTFDAASVLRFLRKKVVRK